MTDKNLYIRLAKAEAMANYQKSELMETLQRGYEDACENENAEEAAELARKIRNKLLDESDKEMSLDRLGLEAPSGTTFSAWLGFLKELGELLTNSWAQYRKALRDLPEQEGFPFNVEFPIKPTDTQEQAIIDEGGVDE